MVLEQTIPYFPIYPTPVTRASKSKVSMLKWYFAKEDSIIKSLNVKPKLSIVQEKVLDLVPFPD